MTGTASPVLLPLRSTLLNRGVKVELECAVELRPRGAVVFSFNGRVNHRQKKRTIVAPLLATHPLHDERRMVIGLGNSLLDRRSEIMRCGLALRCVSQDGVLANPDGIADEVCEYLYRIHMDDLREMVEVGMHKKLIAQLTGLPEHRIDKLVQTFYGHTMRELREEAVERQIS